MPTALAHAFTEAPCGRAARSSMRSHSLGVVAVGAAGSEDAGSEVANLAASLARNVAISKSESAPSKNMSSRTSMLAYASPQWVLPM